MFSHLRRIGVSGLLSFLFWGAVPLSERPVAVSNTSFMSKEVVSLKDFTKEEVRGTGITLSKEITVRIKGVGGGEKAFWRDLFSDERETEQLYAGGWIINAETREPVWEMTMENTSGRSDHRTCDEDLTLKKGSYEVYFAAYGYVRKSGLSYNSLNIDRREGRKSNHTVLGKVFQFFDDRNSEWYEDFMDLAKDTWRMSISVPEGDEASIDSFEAPMTKKQALLQVTNMGDGAFVKKGLSLGKDATIHVYSLGEGRKGDEMFDYGWIVNSATRERVWEMTLRNTTYAGGAAKNRKYEGDLKLPAGMYELYYVTDDSHSNDDWNSKPPYDPFNYGITLTTDADKTGIKVTDVPDTEKNVIVKLTEVRDDEFKNAGFSLKSETRLRVYALGEANGDRDELADYGWIVNAKTRERVWAMDRRNTFHAGGASKNRMIDEIITLPKGNYIAYYQTDGSHSYRDWNSSPPYDEEHWGITIMGVDKDFKPESVGKFSEDEEQGVLVQIVRVRDHERLRERFSLDRTTKLRVYAIGEGRDDEMYDYGWIKDTKTGETVWEMTYGMTSHAGGASKNRMVNRTLTLEKGDYELHFRTDDSHAFNDWNDDPPEDRTHWGISLYKEE